MGVKSRTKLKDIIKRNKYRKYSEKDFFNNTGQ